MVTIREMQIDDLEQVMRIEEGNFSVPWTETGFFSFLIREDTLFLVAEEAEEILGYCGVVTASGEGDITNVAVKRSRQKEGIGGRMLAELLSRLEGAGVGTLFLEVRAGNAGAIHLYRKLGFEEVGVRKNYYEAPREDGIVMKWEAASSTANHSQ